MNEELISSSQPMLHVNANITIPHNANEASNNFAPIQKDVDILLKSNELLTGLHESQPILSKPSTSGADQLTSQAKLTFLLGQVMQLSSDLSVVQLNDNLASVIVRYTAQRNSFIVLSETLQKAIDDLDTAVEEVNIATDGLVEATERHSDAKKELQRLIDKLSQLSPEDSEYQETLLLKQQADINEQKSEAVLAHAENIYISAFLACNTAADNASKAFDAVKKAEENCPLNIIGLTKTKKDTQARFIELIASLLKAIGENNVVSLKEQSKLMKVVNQARLTEMQKNADEVAAKQRTANRLRKGLSIFAAIIGAIMAVVSVVAAIPTGGMSVAGGIGLCFALTSAAFVVTDIALQFTTGFSPMSWLFDKLNTVISFLVKNTLSALVSSMAKGFGASESDVKKAKEYCTLIASSIITTVVVILASICVGGAGASVGKVAGTAAQAAEASVNATVKTATEVIKQVANSASKATKIMNSITRSAKITQVITATLNAVVSPTLSVVAGVNEKEACDALAKLGMSKEDIKFLSSIRKNMTEQSQSVSNASLELNKMLCEVLNDRTNSIQVGYHNIARLGTA